MKLEILEITAPELLDLLSAMNYFDVATLLAEAYAMHAEKQSDHKENYKYVANELVSWCEPLVFNSDTVIDAMPKPEPENDTPEPFLDFETKASLNNWINNGGY